MRPAGASLPARLRDAVLARPGTTGWFPVAIQVVLAILWPPAIFLLLANYYSEDLLSKLAVRLSRLWDPSGFYPSWSTESQAPDLETSVTLAYVFLGAGVILAAIAWVPFSVLVRVPREHAESSPGMYVRCWWRTWLWATVLIPSGACLCAVLAGHDTLGRTSYLLLVALCVTWPLVGPMHFGKRELRPRRLPRWRPVCPECGYSLRRLLSDRCPECGVAFPAKSRVFRRWAIRRLVWDRVERGNLLFAYLGTVAMIVFCPCRAARGLCMPDRYGRAIRWGITHLFGAALLGTASAPFLLDWTPARFPGGGYPPAEITRQSLVPGGAVALWAGQSLAAWLVAIGTLPLVGIGSGSLALWRHPAAKRGTAKWSLYVTAMPLLALIVLCGLPLAWRLPQCSTGQDLLDIFDLLSYRGRVALPYVIGVYAIWWARGVSANPYLRTRGLRSCVLNGILFTAVWLMLVLALFRPGPLTDLL